MRDSINVVLPVVHGSEDFDTLVRKLSVYFVRHIDAPHSFDDLSKAVYGVALKPLVVYLANETQHPATVNALLALKWHFSAIETGDDRGVSDTRALACEVTAWRFVTHLTERDAIDYLCYEVSHSSKSKLQTNRATALDGIEEGITSDESTPLLDEPNGAADQTFVDGQPENCNPDDNVSFTSTFAGLSALEIAAVSSAKIFLSQKAIQRVVDGIWTGDIVFWETLSQHSTKRATIYDKKKSDPFSRLRVPLYLKVFEVLFFAVFIALYYVVLIEKSLDHVSAPEVLLYVWLTAFTYNEFAEFWDAGSTFYATDFWSLWDVGIAAVGIAFFIVRMVGLAKNDHAVTDTAFDILALEALFLVPRICSLLSLTPYFGTLIPCLKEMTKDFVKFLGLIAILYIGFNTTFAFLARGTFSVGKMNWILIKVFFGSSYLGFDIAEKCLDIASPWASFDVCPHPDDSVIVQANQRSLQDRFIFVCLTNILLITSLISLLSNSLTKVMEHAREEYLSGYAVYVLEASTSNRLTYFLPPLNLLPLMLRPLRLVLPANRLRTARIVLLKATHWPFVAAILIYEAWRLHWKDRGSDTPSQPKFVKGPYASASMRRAFSGKSTRLPLLTAGAHEPPLEVVTRAARPALPNPLQHPPAASETTKELEVAVESLRTQLDALAAILRKQTGDAAAAGEGDS